MKQGNNIFLLWAPVAFLLLALAVACQPSGAVEGTLLPPSATPAGTIQETRITDDSPTATSIAEPDAGGREKRLTPALPSSVESIPALEPILVTSQVPAELLDAILEDAEARMGITAGGISIVQAEAVVWSDGSLGCPKPGMMYTQALVPGYRVVLRAGDEILDYHASERGTFVLCAEGLAPGATSPARVVEEVTMPGSPTIPTPASAGLQQLIAQAKEDLALRLSIPTTQIDLIELSSIVWPDGALGCPEPGVAYTQVQQEGLLIRLRAGKRIYPYHGGGGTPPFLCEQAITEDKP